MVEDRLLVLGFKRGRREALRRIYAKYRAEMLKLAVVLAGDANTAEDIVHDVFVNFARSADRIKVTGSLKNYLVTSVINRVRNYRRDTGRHGETALAETALPSSSGRGPEQWAILSEQLTLLAEALGRLPYEQREAVCLHMQAGLTLRQVATVQKASVNTVKGRYRYGMEKLRSLLNSEVEQCDPQIA
ncbi:MAG: RNA polymerase sigma factor [Planctomycetota bacterium]|jgi:RNA polymerase sigma-70 factor (ECF subfamily)